MYKKNFSGKRRRACKGSWSRRGNQKSFTLTIPKNLANLVKIFPGIIVRQRHADQKTNGIADRAVRRIKEGTSAVLLQSGLNGNLWAWRRSGSETHGMPVKLVMISGPFEAIFLQSSRGTQSHCTCREKNHFLFH